jgi:hypothetical protein
MKSALPRPFVNLAKAIVIPVLRNKWKKNETVKGWINNGLINDGEIDWLVLNWHKHKSPIPPPPKIKQKIVAELGQKYNCKALVETGTYKGDMIFAQLNNFEDLYSIELSPQYHSEALTRFKNNKHVNLIIGDSGTELPKLTPKLNKKTLFWLDGHYCGGITALSTIECPIFAELDAIFTSNAERHMILIDDARDFVGKNDYPTIDELRKFVESYNQNYKLEIIDDVIRIYPC